MIAALADAYVSLRRSLPESDYRHHTQSPVPLGVGAMVYK